MRNQINEKIKGIIFFDLDDTLFPTTNFVKKAREKSFNAMIDKGLNEDNLEQLKINFEKVYKLEGTNSQTHYQNLLSKYYKIKSPEIEKLVAIAIISYYSEKENMKTFPRTYEILKKLQKKFILAIISSGDGIKQWDKIYRLKLDKYFNKENILITKSSNFEKNEEGYKKIFEKYSKKYETKNIWMIGDREDNDIIPAKKIGFKTIRIGTGKYNFDYKKTIADYKYENIYKIDFKIF